MSLPIFREFISKIKQVWGIKLPWTWSRRSTCWRFHEEINCIILVRSSGWLYTVVSIRKWWVMFSRHYAIMGPDTNGLQLLTTIGNSGLIEFKSSSIEWVEVGPIIAETIDGCSFKTLWAYTKVLESLGVHTFFGECSSSQTHRFAETTNDPSQAKQLKTLKSFSAPLGGWVSLFF